MTNLHKHKLARRSVLRCGAAAMCLNTINPSDLLGVVEKISSHDTLKAIAHRKGKLVATFSGQHELMTDSVASQTIASECDMVAIGNDLKMNRIHPQPDLYDFSYGDWDLDWSKRNNLLFRGHTLVWHNALPSWFQTYVNKENAQRVMIDHITTVMKHYSGKMYSWDVVNEPIHAGQPNDRPDGLRSWPWLQLIGADYIEIAFRTAALADPAAKLFLNECFIEQDLPLHAIRRDALLRVATDLKKRQVPITGLGVEGHIRADTPLATVEFGRWLRAVRELGLEIMITELDVDDSGIPGPQVDDAVARRYVEFLELVGPFVSVINFYALEDYVGLPKRPDGLIHRPNLFDTSFQKKPAYYATAKALADLIPTAPDDLKLQINR
jgi:endo-1,4-beta-xylanase